jgi:hypothetical protein
MAIVAEVVAVTMTAYFLWQKLFLPQSYAILVTFLALLIAVSIVKLGEQHRRLVAFEIILVSCLVRSVFYVSTQNVIPFGDPYWDYAVVKIFAQANRIFVVSANVFPVEVAGQSELTWYSGWPLLHTLGLIFSRVTGSDPLYLNLVLPLLFGFVSLAFVYLIAEKLGRQLGLPKETIILALFIYVMTPEIIYWNMEFVRQGFALSLFTIFVYLLCVVTCSQSQTANRRYVALAFFLALCIVVAHHFTSFTLVMFLFLMLILTSARRLSARSKIDFPWSGKPSLLALAVVSLAFLLVWWDSFGKVIWSTASFRLDRLMEVLISSRFQFWAPAGSYPAALRPGWIVALLRLRDLVLYTPAVVGLLLVWRKRTKAAAKYFIICSTVALAMIFFVDDVFFALEPFRVVDLTMPLVAFLSAVLYMKIRKVSELAWKLTVFSFTFLVLTASFTGFWAHDYAPVHLYDPSVSSISVGEVRPDFIRLKPFFEQKVSLNDIQVVWTDSYQELLYLLDPPEYDKIIMLGPANMAQIDRRGNGLVASFRDFNLYRYYGWIWGTVQTPEEAENLRHELAQSVNGEDNRIYDDGSSVLWTVSGQKPP